MNWAEARIIDASHWNPEEDDRTHHKLMDWDRAITEGNCVGMIAKYTQGSSGVDPAAFLHAYNASVAGVPLLGGYHFGDSSDPNKQAAHFLDLMKQDYAGDLRGRLLMLDAERNATSQMSIRQAEIFALAIFNAVGRWPWYYGNKNGPDGTGKGFPSKILSNCKLLIPAYGKHSDADLVQHLMPSGMQAKNLVATQFTDGRINGGPFPGLGVVDQSRFVGVPNLEAAKAIWAS